MYLFVYLSIEVGWIEIINVEHVCPPIVVAGRREFWHISIPKGSIVRVEKQCPQNYECNKVRGSQTSKTKIIVFTHVT